MQPVFILRVGIALKELPPVRAWRRVCTDIEHIRSTFGGTINIDICSTFADRFHINVNIHIKICLRPLGDKVNLLKSLRWSGWIFVDCARYAGCLYMFRLFWYVQMWVHDPFCLFCEDNISICFWHLINICWEPCWHSTSTCADIWIDICTHPYQADGLLEVQSWGEVPDMHRLAVLTQVLAGQRLELMGSWEVFCALSTDSPRPRGNFD